MRQGFPIRRGVMLLGLLTSTAALAKGPSPSRDPLVQRAERFLAAYADADEQRVLGFVTSGTPHIYGSDAAELVASRAALIDLLRADHRLWAGAVAFGPLRHVSEERSGSLATLFFDTDFSISGHVVPLRFATVWRREQGSWKLVQSSNAQLTNGQSAAALTHKPKYLTEGDRHGTAR